MNARLLASLGLAWSAVWTGASIGFAIAGAGGWPSIVMWICAAVNAGLVWWQLKRLHLLRERHEVARAYRQISLKAIACILVWKDRDPSSPRHHLAVHARDSALAAVGEAQRLRMKLKFGG